MTAGTSSSPDVFHVEDVKPALYRSLDVVGVRVEGAMLTVAFADGRSDSMPLDPKWYGWLIDATPEQQANWHQDRFKVEIDWPLLDEGVPLWEVFGCTENLVYDAAGFKKGWPDEE